MKHVIFVAPFFLEQTVRFLSAICRHPGTKVSLIHQDAVGRLDEGIRHRLHSARQIGDALDPQQISTAVKELARELGPPQRLLGILENLQEALAEVRRANGIPGMDPHTALLFRDKGLMKDALRVAGVPCAAAARAESKTQAIEAARTMGFPLVAKPPDGAGARQTFRLEDENALQTALVRWPPGANNPWLLEAFLSGREHSFDAVSIDGRLLWHSISHYFPGPLEVLENPWVQWCVILPRTIDGPEYDSICQVAPQALQALGMQTGLSHMEWFQRPDGSVAVSEVGARPPGAQFMTLMSYAHDTDMYRAWAELVIDESFAAPVRQYAVGAVYLRGMGHGTIKAVHGLEEAQKEIGPLVMESRLPKYGRPGSSGYEGDGVVIVRHSSTSVVKDACSTLLRTLRVELGEVHE